MMILNKKRDELIDSLNINDAMRKLTNGEFIHDELEFRCLELKYSLEPEDFSPTNLELVPLWESESSITGFYYDEQDQPVFIHYYVDDIEDYKVIGRSNSELIDHLIDEYVEYEFENEVRGLLTSQ